MADGHVPDIQDAVQAMVQIENPKAVKKGIVAYQQTMDSLAVPTRDVQTFNNQHASAEAAANSEFKKSSFYDSDGSFQQELKVSITVRRKVIGLWQAFVSKGFS